MALSLLTRRAPGRRRRARQSRAGRQRAPSLQKLLSEQVATLPVLSDVIGRRYFNLVEKDANWVRARSRVEP